MKELENTLIISFAYRINGRATAKYVMPSPESRTITSTCKALESGEHVITLDQMTPNF